MLYFAYGSNLLLAQMMRRCPSAEVVGRAWLPNHRLAFRGWSGGWGGAVATVVPDEGSAVAGVVYRIRDDVDVDWLDYFEGCPTVYRCERVRVRLEKYQRMRCWTYMKNDGAEGWPSTEYARTIATGLKQHGHDVATLAAALGRIGTTALASAPRPVAPAAAPPRPVPAPEKPLPPLPAWATAPLPKKRKAAVSTFASW
jgi:cation transport regulator ChaC